MDVVAQKEQKERPWKDQEDGVGVGLRRELAQAGDQEDEPQGDRSQDARKGP